ncbi:MAG: hypothetical protein EON58_17475 [Alphaproteobacteria bacterium]|nr:MAG: hypothetical protein EON58_17475 [Alphaproteobacteria bacterium]
MKLDKKLIAKIEATYSGKDGAVGTLSLAAPIRPYLAKLKAAIPGQWDDVAIDLATKAAEVAVGAEEVAVAAAAATK